MGGMRRQILVRSNLPGLPLAWRGKVRDIYDFGDSLLLVTTDRISAFDVIMPTPIPDKGVILTQLSLFWFKRFENRVKNHLISSSMDDFPAECHSYREQLDGRSVLVKKAEPLPVECIVRGYLVGSGWKEYKRARSVCGVQLPEGLLEASKLNEPIFTPTTKAERGFHDENISFEQMANIVGKETAEKVRDLSIAIYERGAEEALKKGIIIADTKFEFGFFEGELLLIDEVLTPDSSRFWPASEYEPGRSQKSFDKQYLRDYLMEIGWNPELLPPELPESVVRNTRARYLEAYRRLTGRSLDDGN